MKTNKSVMIMHSTDLFGQLLQIKSFVKLDEDIIQEEDFTIGLEKAEQVGELRRELALLSHEYRECTVAYYIDGLSCAQTSARLNKVLSV